MFKDDNASIKTNYSVIIEGCGVRYCRDVE